MTQKEAREFLINKKVFVKDKSKEIQLKLFKLGFKWLGDFLKEPKYLDYPFLYIYKDMTLVAGYCVNTFYENNYEEISAEDILNIKIEYLPKTWEEFCESNPIKEGEVAITTWSTMSKLKPNRKRISTMDKCALLNSSVANSHIALMQLHQLRDCYRGNADPSACYYSITRSIFNLLVECAPNRFLSFQTEAIANEFLHNFRDLIEQAGDLI